MTCDRCYDIHLGQLNGTNCNSCQCDCHLVSDGGTTTSDYRWLIPNFESTPTTTPWRYDNRGTDQT